MPTKIRISLSVKAVALTERETLYPSQRDTETLKVKPLKYHCATAQYHLAIAKYHCPTGNITHNGIAVVLSAATRHLNYSLSIKNPPCKRWVFVV